VLHPKIGSIFPKRASGVIQEGACADILLIDGNPLDDIKILANPEKNINLIMKDGVIYKYDI